MSARPSFKNVPTPAAEPAGDRSLTTCAAASAAFDRLDFSTGGPVVIALSGGSDSTALLHLLQDYLTRTQSATRLIAATVDHGLRAESAGEAEHVGRWSAELGVPHRVLRWSAGPERAGLQARGRMARYELLADLAETLGAAMVLTGHTADDQAETVAMRRARAATGIGLSGIDEATLYRRKNWFVRPLLTLARADLRSFLAGEAIGWMDDPSNDDDRFERVRVRAELAGDPERRARMLAIADGSRTERRHQARRGAACLADRDVWQVLGGGIVFDPPAAAKHETDALMAAMAGVLTHIGRLPRLADAARAGTALAFCRTAANGQSFTIAGCRLRMSTGRVVMEADPRHQRAAGESGFAHLLPLSDWPLAQAMGRLADGEPDPPPPLAAASRLRWQDTLVAV